MKRLWSAFVCFVIALSLCTFEIIYTTSAADKLNNIVSRARREFNRGAGDSTKAAETLDEAKKLWEECEGVMNIFLYHDNVDTVGIGIESAKSLIKSGKEEADVQLLELMDSLKTIKKSEQPLIENIL